VPGTVPAPIGQNAPVRISAKADYAVRAAVELALADGASLPADVIAERQDIPVQFLQKILIEMRRGNLVATQRGRDGGHKLARPAGQISVADVLRAVEGQLADVRGQAPEDVVYRDSAAALQDVWIALRTNMRAVLERVSLADLAANELPQRITKLANADGARTSR
jgi:Rrf2 family protein